MMTRYVTFWLATPTHPGTCDRQVHGVMQHASARAMHFISSNQNASTPAQLAFTAGAAKTHMHILHDARRICTEQELYSPCSPFKAQACA